MGDLRIKAFGIVPVRAEENISNAPRRKRVLSNKKLSKFPEFVGIKPFSKAMSKKLAPLFHCHILSLIDCVY
jgi:hypothetical protein